MKNFKNSHGITIIALTVTIVIMLILSSIIITSFNTGDNSIERANDSKIYTELKQMKEELEQYKVNLYTNSQLRAGNFSGEITSEQLSIYLKTDGIATEFSNIDINKNDTVGNANNDKTNRTIGIINTTNFAQKLRLKNNVTENSESGNIEAVIPIGNNFNSYNPTSSSINNLKQFDDVFAIDFGDETLYYVKDGRIWLVETN